VIGQTAQPKPPLISQRAASTPFELSTCDKDCSSA